MAKEYFGSAEFHYDWNTVFNATMNALQYLNEFQITFADHQSGHIRLEVGMSLSSWGENISINVVPTSDSSARVEIYSVCKQEMTLVDWGKNKKNVNQILQAISMRLASVPPQGPSGSNLSFK